METAWHPKTVQFQHFHFSLLRIILAFSVPVKCTDLNRHVLKYHPKYTHIYTRINRHPKWMELHKLFSLMHRGDYFADEFSCPKRRDLKDHNWTATNGIKQTGFCILAKEKLMGWVGHGHKKRHRKPRYSLSWKRVELNFKKLPGLPASVALFQAFCGRFFVRMGSSWEGREKLDKYGLLLQIRKRISSLKAFLILIVWVTLLCVGAPTEQIMAF